jgi:hypothetical protein
VVFCFATREAERTSAGRFGGDLTLWKPLGQRVAHDAITDAEVTGSHLLGSGVTKQALTISLKCLLGMARPAPCVPDVSPAPIF